jgi:hypothetical protein
LDVDIMLGLCRDLGLNVAPILYRGPWDPNRVKEWSEGLSTLYSGHVREGFVVRPVKERFHDTVGRVILKLHGQGYLLKI